MVQSLAAGPAEPFAEVKARIAAAIESHRDEILELSHQIHADPEPAFEEHHAADRVAGAIARYEYSVEAPAGRLATAVRGVLRGGRGPAGARIGILAEYDALPGLGHGCGHNTMAASAVGAAIALSTVADAFAGEVVFLGCPAEERGSGKQAMLDDGLFDGLDAALLYHPADRTHTEIRALASVDVEVTFTGLQSHAAANPWLGKNALDALVLLFQSIGLWRQQLHPDARVHGIVLEGGTAANIIPDRAVGRFMLRSMDEAAFAEMRERFRRMVEAAALATDTRGEAVFSGGTSTMNNNLTIGARFGANLRAYGLEDGPPNANPGSTDMGNVSWRLPTIHPYVATFEPGTPWHSVAAREGAVSARGDEMTLLAAVLVAQTAFELLADRALVDAAWHEFRGGA